MCSANAQGRSPEGTTERRRRRRKRWEVKKGCEGKKAREGEVKSGLQDWERGRREREKKGGEERRGGRRQSSCTLS